MIQSEPEPISETYQKLVSLDISIKSSSWTSLEFNIHQYCQKIVDAVLLYVVNQDDSGLSVEVSLLLSDDNNLQHLNMEYRNKDEPTNVLSFPFSEASRDEIMNMVKSKKHLFLGDIAISYERVMKESLQQEKRFIEHFSHILIHGVLHLFKYDHITEEDAELMEDMEGKVMRSLGFDHKPIRFTDDLVGGF
jgi:probable rRNA maturation factor